MKYTYFLLFYTFSCILISTWVQGGFEVSFDYLLVYFIFILVVSNVVPHKPLYIH